ncbi:hypothetical protein E4P41_16410 [Geodermatophilus sp. DF01-2]|nr:hypothetical protein E4P41_16410 [Geodermatophilus sp. DF01_2]
MNGSRAAPGREPAARSGETCPVCTSELVQPVSSQCAIWYSKASPIDSRSVTTRLLATVPATVCPSSRSQADAPMVRAQKRIDCVPLPAAVASPRST